MVPQVIDPTPAYVTTRGQYDTRQILPALEKISAYSGERVVGLTALDLFSAVFTYVFGEAQLEGAAAIVSLHRLDPRVYGLPDDPGLLVDRLQKEALHETGHLLGLVHCSDPECVMRFSSVAEEIDLKLGAFCPRCREQLDRSP
jgi:archaemetzincin